MWQTTKENLSQGTLSNSKTFVLLVWW